MNPPLSFFLSLTISLTYSLSPSLLMPTPLPPLPSALLHQTANTIDLIFIFFSFNIATPLPQSSSTPAPRPFFVVDRRLPRRLRQPTTANNSRLSASCVIHQRHLYRTSTPAEPASKSHHHCLASPLSSDDSDIRHHHPIRLQSSKRSIVGFYWV